MRLPYNPADPLSDFRNFLRLAWKALNLSEPSTNQLEMAWFLQYEPNPHKMIEALRGVGKSWIAAAYAVWRLYHDKSLNILVVSGSKAKADQFTTFCLRLIQEIPILQHMRPRDGQRASMTGFDVAGAPPSQTQSVVSLGVTSQLTGNRADLIIPDDVETPNNSDTQAQREKLAERIKEFEDIIKPGGEIAYLGTPQTEDSIYNRLASRGYTVRIWPAEYPNAVQRERYGAQLSPVIAAAVDADPGLVGHTTEPRFTDETLAMRKLREGAARFALQYMLDTNLSDVEKYPLKVSDLIVHSLNPDEGPEKLMWARDPELIVKDLPNVAMERDLFYRPIPTANKVNYLPYTGSVMFIDPAGKGADETGYAVVKYLHGLLFVMDVGAFKGYGDETMQGLAEIAKRYKVKHIRAEENFGNGMFTQLLKPHLQRIYPVAVEDFHSVGQKEKRIIDTLEPVMNQHRLIVDRDLIRKDYDSVAHLPVDEGFMYRLIYQLTRITRDRKAIPHDDRVEALAGAVAYWVEQMARDVDKAVVDAQVKEWWKDMKQHMEHQAFRPTHPAPKKRGWLRER